MTISNLRFKLWPLIPALGAADTVIFVDPQNLAAHSGRNFPQFPLLIGCCLVNRRNPKIENRALHGKSPFDTPAPYFNCRQKPLFFRTDNQDSENPDFIDSGGGEFARGFSVHSNCLV
jgi:hypothetical protein